MASFLRQATGAEFPIVSEKDADEQSVKFVIGPGELSKKLLASIGAEPEETIPRDGIILQTVGNSIVLSGHPRRGSLYAVYTFLEDVVGIRWWTSTESFIPKMSELTVPPLAVRYAPRVISRETYYLDPHNGHEGAVFSARMRTNGNFNEIPEEYGGHDRFM